MNLNYKVISKYIAICTGVVVGALLTTMSCKFAYNKFVSSSVSENKSLINLEVPFNSDLNQEDKHLSSWRNSQEKQTQEKQTQEKSVQSPLLEDPIEIQTREKNMQVLLLEGSKEAQSREENSQVASSESSSTTQMSEKNEHSHRAKKHLNSNRRAIIEGREIGQGGQRVRKSPKRYGW
jgi:septum formation inhibitor MinC